MKLFVGADHNGFELKKKVIAYLKKTGYDVDDEGDEQFRPEDDFTVYAARVVHAMKAEGEDSRGIVICGSGQGMLIAANRFRGIRAGLGWSKEAARAIRNDEDSNVLALPSRLFTKDDEWQEVVSTWLLTPFAGAARYRRRNRQLDEL
jgi:ribose 5-phosphate isomerase B